MKEKNLNNEKESNAKKKFEHLLLVVFILLCLVGLGFMVFKRLTKKEIKDLNPIQKVNVTYIRKGTINKEISVMGNILPNDTYYVISKVSGDIKNIYVKNGDKVKKGDAICDIDADKEIEAAFIQYDTAKKSYERMKKLYASGDISLQSFESVKAQYDGYKLAYDTKVEYATPVAVGDGVVENTNMTINTAISTGTMLCYITSNDAKEVNFGVTERVLDGIEIGDKVIIEKNGKEYEGYISNKANLIDAETGLFKVKAIINSENTFASGVMAKVTIVYEKKNNINILSNDMIYYENGNAFVYVIDNNIVKKKYFEAGIENTEYTEVLSGLSKEDKIISTWNKSLAEGSIAEIINEERIEDEIYETENHEIPDLLINIDDLSRVNRTEKDDIASPSFVSDELATFSEIYRELSEEEKEVYINDMFKKGIDGEE